MAEYLIQSATLTAIADAIRAKLGGSSPIAVSALASAIGNLTAPKPTQTKSVTVTANGQVVLTPDTGYEMTQATVNVSLPVSTLPADAPLFKETVGIGTKTVRILLPGDTDGMLSLLTVTCSLSGAAVTVTAA